MACVIHELAGGKHPYRRLPSTDAREQRLDLQLQRPRHLPEHCWPALRTALALDARDRAISVEELYHAVAHQGAGCVVGSRGGHDDQRTGSRICSIRPMKPTSA
ncbi:hypothetical protein PBOI14_28630 [Pseudomonas sp. Boi14]|nr:hypothetical protein PBOI14_28630 [Pseudomonas sp. Boi14]